jgi:hypothetical protein
MCSGKHDWENGRDKETSVPMSRGDGPPWYPLWRVRLAGMLGLMMVLKKPRALVLMQPVSAVIRSVRPSAIGAEEPPENVRVEGKEIEGIKLPSQERDCWQEGRTVGENQTV